MAFVRDDEVAEVDKAVVVRGTREGVRVASRDWHWVAGLHCRKASSSRADARVDSAPSRLALSLPLLS